ncbi:hypothetical protein VRRI112168_00450 [Vreelandella rituensis]|uniref:Uncharacterized protein n=1 Tax=Vreelandella rituensis TaxID=2282306 RepID=A0A368UDH4_9GAMM|nr:hypothetical protein [Halomonas rituensis]RCV93833.1 hypothetical protein DU506_01360 [Halomonas rituensis]
MSEKKQTNKTDLRQLRGDALARHVVRLNGHQRPLRFIIFEPYWMGMIFLPIPFLAMIPFLKSVLMIGLLGLCFEASLWVIYAIRNKRLDTYPGLVPWWNRFVRRSFMSQGRPGSRHSRM